MKAASAIVDEYIYDLMHIMFQHFEYDQQMKRYKLTDFSADLNALNEKFDNEENRQCLTDLIRE